jgi:iron complex transport system ATP-binding protein
MSADSISARERPATALEARDRGPRGFATGDDGLLRDGLVAQHVHVRAGTHPLLTDVTLGVPGGEFVAVLGANGAGKSTLLRLLAGDRLGGALRAGGDVHLAGRPIRAWRPRELARRRAVLPQHPSLAFGYTALELAALGRHAHVDEPATALTIARAALHATDALHLADREVPTLSGGERARAHLACALAQLWDTEFDGPRYLLLDEPTAALDLAHQHEVLAIVREFARVRGIGVVAVLHDLNLAAEYSDRVVVLAQGRVAADGPPDVLEPACIRTAFGVRAAAVPHPLRPGRLIAVMRLGVAVGSIGDGQDEVLLRTTTGGQ